jgi:RNA polymerase sigma-B factor
VQATTTNSSDETRLAPRRRTRRVASDTRRRSDRRRNDQHGADDDRFWRYRASGDRALRNELIEDHRWLALHCAKRFADKGEPLDDLVQVAMLGVLKAVERFDPDFGATFATFAVPTITGELRRHFRDATWAVHVPRRAKDLQHTVKSAVNELAQVLGRSPTVDEIAGHASLPVEEVLEALEAARCYRKTPLAPSAADDAEFDDMSSFGSVDHGIDVVDAAATVERLLDTLPPRERRIIELRYVSGLTQTQIAGLVGVSQVQVSRLLRASLARMNGTLDDPAASCSV